MSKVKPAYLIVGGMIAGMMLRRALVKEGRALGMDVRLDCTRRHPELSAQLRRFDQVLGGPVLGPLLVWGDKWEVITGPLEDVTRLKIFYDEEWFARGRSKRRAMVLGGEEENQVEVERILELLAGARREGKG